MATIKIDFTKAEKALAEMRSIKRSISSIKTGVGGVRSNITNTSASMALLKAALRSLEDDILENAAKMDSFASALESIIDTLKRCENSAVSSNSPSSLTSDLASENTPDWVKNIWDWFVLKLKEFGFIDIVKPEREETVSRLQEREMDLYMQTQISEIRRDSRFSESTWNMSSAEERQQILRDYFERVAAVMGLSDIPLYFAPTQPETINGTTYTTNGGYYPDQDFVCINSWVIENRTDSYYLFKTIVHELRHAYQQKACRDPESFIVSEETLEEWQDSINKYKNTEGFENEGMSREDAYDAYRNQAIEKDARKFAKQ